MTRQEYLRAGQGLGLSDGALRQLRAESHRAYYAQFVAPSVLETVRSSIGLERLRASADDHFNDIPLSKWDVAAVPVPASVAAKMRELGDYPTLAGTVCVLKEAARQLLESAA